MQLGWLVKELPFHGKEGKRGEIGEERRSSGSRKVGRAGVLPPFYGGNGSEPIDQAKLGLGRTEKRCY